MSFFEELKRRNVVKTMILYVVASWMILQIADVLFEALDLPTTWLRLVLALLILGFPLATIFSWVYELTPGGVRREKDIEHSDSVASETGRKIDILIVVMLAMAIASVAMDQLIGRMEPYAIVIALIILLVVVVLAFRYVAPANGVSVVSDDSNSVVQHSNTVDQSNNTIAVMPFLNLSSDSEQEYFSDGLSEELLNLLSKIPELKVAARTSSFSFKDSEDDVIKIGKKLDVAHVLEGSVRKSGDRVRITAQLIQAVDGFHLWSDTYDRTLNDVFAIQDEIARIVVEQLKVNLLGSVPSVRDTDPDAYALFLQARHLCRQGTIDAFNQSIAKYKQALAIDPDYVEALHGLAAVYCDQADRGRRPAEEGYELARKAIGEALARDPNLAKGHSRLGMIAINYDNDLKAAALHLERALELDPTDIEILGDCAMLASSLGMIEKAIEVQEFVRSHDPVNARVHRRVGVSYLFGGRLDDALLSLQTSLDLSPGMLGSHQMRGIVFLLKDKPRAALEEMEKDEDSWRQVGLVMAHHALGQTAESDAALAKAIEDSEKIAAYNIAFVLAFRNEVDRAFEWLEKATKYKDTGLSQIAIMPLFANLYNDPRWLPFLEGRGRSPKQLSSIKFALSLKD